MPGIVDELKCDLRFIEGLKACLGCGVCTAVCPAARFYEYSPRDVTMLVQQGDEVKIEELLKSDTIWYCGECLSCKTRCPRGNTPGYIIQALRKLSQQKGYFTHSRLGRQQLKVKRIIGDTMMERGYCVYVDNVGTDYHPEQGPVWDWFRKNTATVARRVGANYGGTGPGSMRRISESDLIELRSIFAETGAVDFFENIETMLADERNE